MPSNFENLSFDLAPQLGTLIKEGKIKPEVSIEGADGIFCGSFRVGIDGEHSVVGEDMYLADAAFPVIVYDQRQRREPLRNEMVASSRAIGPLLPEQSKRPRAARWKK